MNGKPTTKEAIAKAEKAGALIWRETKTYWTKRKSPTLMQGFFWTPILAKWEIKCKHFIPFPQTPKIAT